MVYMGSKSRHAKEMLKLILKDMTQDRWYVEPFCGGCNVIDKVKFPKRIASDSNYYLVRMWEALVDGWEPPDVCTKTFYEDVRDHKEDWGAPMVGYIGFNASYNGKFFGGWTGSYTARDYYAEKRRNIMKQLEGLKGTHFVWDSYLECPVPENSIVYCDPPYAGSTQYKDEFDSVGFWDWAKVMTQFGRKVFVSEYTAPEGWKAIWEKEVNSSLTPDTGSKKATEKLFVYEI